MSRHYIRGIIVGVLLIPTTGCHLLERIRERWHRPAQPQRPWNPGPTYPAYPGYPTNPVPPGQPGAIYPPPPGTQPGGEFLLPGNQPGAPQPGVPQLGPVQPPGSSQSGFTPFVPPAFESPKPVAPATARDTPAPPVADPKAVAPRLLPPDLREPVGTSEPAPSPATSPKLPVGIPGFTEVTTGISNGLRPDLEGLDWLKSNGYRSVLNLRKPGASETADRAQVQARGMSYLSLEVSPERLNQNLLDEFARIVGDAPGRPLFVYDNGGGLSGALWYLYLRTVIRMSDDAARARAASIGLKESGPDGQTELWLAIRKLVAERGDLK